ncbi:MAG TPA: peptidylprolyl isomerase [Vicinamibacterales bacterium]|nr:peptidylprolyl isomerase [Vicinamibacterales bacterium]
MHALVLLLALGAPVLTTAGPATDAKLIQMYVRNGVAELGIDARTAEGRDKLAQLEQAVRDEFRDREIVRAEARRRGLPVAAQLEPRRARWVARLGGDAAYRAYLAEHHLTPAEFDRVIEQEIAAELLRDELTREVTVGPAEVAAFYDRERSNRDLEPFFVEPEQVTASHILIAARRGLHDDMEARRARAEQIRRELLAGGDFAALARRYSDDPGTRERGGDLGRFARDTHTARFDEAAFALAPGETSAVIQTEFGFHIIRVTARTPRRVRTLDELRPAIEARLRAQKAAQHLNAWLEARRSAVAGR